jgi:hypothetical protein
VGCLTYALLGLLLLGGGGALLIWQWDRSASSDLADAIAEVRRRGEPLTFAELAPQPGQAGVDGGALYRQAMAAFVKPGADFETAYASGVTIPLPEGFPSPDPVVVRALQANAVSLQLLRQAMQRPHCRILRDYHTTRPLALPLDDLAELRCVARLLRAELAHALTAGDRTRSVEIVRELFGLSELLGDEPLLIAQLVRIALGRMALESLADCLAHSAASDAELDALEQLLHKLADRFSLKRGIVGERAWIYTGLSFSTAADWEIMSGWPGWLYGLAPLRKNDQALCLRYLSRAADLVDQTGPEADDAMRKLEAEIEQLADFRFAIKLLYPALATIRDAGLRYRQALHNARWGVVAVRHFRKQGEWPEALSDIADPPELLSLEGMRSGKPLVYRLLPEGGIVIYDVGRNQVDDRLDAQDRDETVTMFRVVQPQGRE